ncbi:MAG TPA: 16S rRNA (adenine(1518)-N(6)/adenine(1519)-N(6))-dimethyltransferase RsmA [Bryobacteraceae bacterium]|nr:16S rRNA (adenine(1518)-N(6)/adenine(1519)-N(6))-dimethyltransferase RsmA [Bryobacteraceae bacterium]
MARQKLGQHFLTRGSVLQRIAAAACPQPAGAEGGPDGAVIEIGPGRGALTAKLLERAARVIAIEVDPHLAAHLRSRFAGEPRLEIVQADVLATDLAQWGRLPVVGNLPYYITSPILEKTVRLGAPRAVFLIQKEVAERLVATPGSRDYGFLTVATALFAITRLLFEVQPAAFHPPPKVDSAVVLLEPRAAGWGIEEPEDFLRFVGLCFRHKRKTLRNNLAETYGKDVVDAWPEAGLRAEQIPMEGFVAMYRRLSGRSF